METIIEVIEYDGRIEVNIRGASRINVIRTINSLLKSLEEEMTFSRITILSLIEDLEKRGVIK